MNDNTTWLVNVSVTINNVTIQLPAFNNSCLIGVMSSVPGSWTNPLYQSYNSLETIISDFTPLLSEAISIGDTLAANRLQWLLDSASSFFGEALPSSFYIAAIPPQTNGTNYTALLNNLTAAQNNFYSYTICDTILESTYSIVTASITVSYSCVIPAGTQLTGFTTTQPYELLQDVTLPGAGTFSLSFFSRDGITTVPPGSFTGINPSPGEVTGVTNATSGNVGIPGFSTLVYGISAAHTALRSVGNNKKLFLGTNDPTVAGAIQTVAGSLDALVVFHSLHFENYTASVRQPAAAACLSAFFNNIFSAAVGMKPLSSQQLQTIAPDDYVTPSNIGSVDVAGGPTNLLGSNNNVYAGFGNGLGGMQYGTMSNSKPSNIVYLDQSVGSDYLEFVVRANLVTYILNQQPLGGIPYTDLGIAALRTAFISSVQKAVDQGILQPFSNSDFPLTTKAQVPPAERSARTYNYLAFNGNFLGRIQRIKVFVNLTF